MLVPNVIAHAAASISTKRLRDDMMPPLLLMQASYRLHTLTACVAYNAAGESVSRIAIERYVEYSPMVKSGRPA